MKRKYKSWEEAMNLREVKASVNRFIVFLVTVVRLLFVIHYLKTDSS